MNAAAQLYEDRHLTVRDGLKLHYRDYPGDTSKPPILCLAGLTRNSRDFADFAERYSPRFRVLALDFRGRGMSDYDPMPARYLPPTYAYDVIELLDQRAIPQAIFVGTSLGGLVTMAVAALAPQRIAAAILNDVGPELSDAGLDRIKSYVGKGVQFKDWDEVARAIASNNSHAFESYTADDWIRMAKRNMREDNGEIVFDYDMAIAEPFKAAGPAPEIDMWPLFAALARKPLLVIRGANSDLLSAEALDKMRSAAAAMKSVVVPGVGHAPDLSEPEAVAAIDEFLGAIEAAA
ncbi:MAG: alpha/beta fold hydrolase [Sphingomicrobium sp.]